MEKRPKKQEFHSDWLCDDRPKPMSPEVAAMTEEEIEAWVDKDKPYDKAGGYAAQSAFGVHIEKTEGNFFTILGLPIHKLYDMLKNV